MSKTKIHEHPEPLAEANIASGAILLPPKPDVCQACATKHALEQPHNQQSIYWQYWFRGHHGRWPTWADALETCSPEVKKHWVTELAKHGITVKFPTP